MSFFHGASPYIEGHRGRTFVIVIPGEVVGNKPLLYPLIEDVALLHGASLAVSVLVLPSPCPTRKQAWMCTTNLTKPARLQLARVPGLGVRLVLVLGVRPGIDGMVRDGGHEPAYSHGQRVTDGVAMEAAMQAAGAVRMEVEARLSKGATPWRPAVSVTYFSYHVLLLYVLLQRTDALSKASQIATRRNACLDGCHCII